MRQCAYYLAQSNAVFQARSITEQAYAIRTILLDTRSMQAPVDTSSPVLISEGAVVRSGDTETTPVSKSARVHICAFQ